MDKDLWVIVVFVGIFTLFGVMMFGDKIGRGSSYDNCIDYYSDLSVTDARKLCRQIVVLGRKGQE
jgi:hypothetical protein